MLLLSLQCKRSFPLLPDSLYRSIEARFEAGDLLAAGEESSRAIAAAPSSGPVWGTKFRLQQAKIRLYQGHSREALLLLEGVSPASQRDPALAVTRYSLLSIAYSRTGDSKQAQQTLLQAQNASAGSPLAEVSLSECILAIESSRFDVATHACEQNLTSAQASGERFQQTQALLNLGVLALRQEHYDDALYAFKQAAAVANAIGARMALEKATGNVGGVFYKVGDFRHALENSQLAEKQASASGSPIDQVQWLEDAGKAQYKLGDLSAARTSYEKSYQLARSIQNYEEMGSSLVALSYLSLETGDLPGALRQAQEAEQTATQNGDTDPAPEPLLVEAQVEAQSGQIVGAWSQLLKLLDGTPGVFTKPSVRWRIEGALAALSVQRGDRVAADIWYRRAIQTFRQQRSSVTDIEARLPFIENGSSLYLDAMENLIRQERPTDALRILDQSRAETLAEGFSSGAVSTKGKDRQWRGSATAVARRLNGTILTYSLRPDISYLWVVTPRQSAFFRLPGKEVILSLIESHRRAILAAKDVLIRENSAGQALYRDLVEPARKLIPAGAKVFVIADDDLNRLNLETVIVPGERPHFWIEDVDLIYAKSLSLLVAGSGSRPHAVSDGEKLLLIGDPIYTRPEYPRLSHASEEVASVASHFAPDRRLVLTGAQATPAAYFSSRPEGFDYIHFVAHGTASDVEPLDSAVVLSMQHDASASFKLYARNILDRRIDADLVTISACYGSGVRTYTGEGLVGLAWAFLRAGSHQVVGALWEVSDSSTSQLMNDLYAGIAAGRSPDFALRSAKLAMIEQGGSFRKPFYWAAFQLYSGS